MTPDPTLADLIDEVAEFITSYVVMPSDEALEAVVLWTLHTWAFEATPATPYLLLLSPERRSGKTLLLEVLELIVRRPWRVSSASEAAIFRRIGADTPALLLDEVDAIFTSKGNERTEALRAVLNAGNRRGSSVARCVVEGGEVRAVDFSVYCPKCLSGIDTGQLPDTIRDRGVEIRMQRRAPGEMTTRFRRRHVEPVAEELRAKLAAWASPELIEQLADADPALPAQLNDRAADAWEGLLAIADLAGRGDRARHAALALAAVANVDETSLGTRLLTKIHELIGTASAISTTTIIGAVNADEELPFGGWSAGAGITGREVARLVKPYGLRPGTIRDGGTTAKGYHRDAAMEQAFARYVAPPRQDPSQASQASQPASDGTDELGDVTDVTDVTLLDGRVVGDA